MEAAYDPVGNVIKTENLVPGSGIGGGTSTLTSNYKYDSLNRLIEATGRQNDAPPNTSPYDDMFRSYDPNTTVAYKHEYSYDGRGNMLQTKRWVDNIPIATKNFNYNLGNNKLANIEIGSDTYNFNYDGMGNITSRELSSQYVYNTKGQIIFYKVQTGDNEPSKMAMYLHDNAGNRRIKFTRTQGGAMAATFYLDPDFEKIITFNQGNPNNMQAQTVTYLNVNGQRKARSRHGASMGDPLPPLLRFLHDHLGSSTTTLDEYFTVIREEEYYPFGETSFGGYASKRYRYTSKERDLETGLYYYGARYYDPFTCRFTGVDPLAGEYAYLSPYNYADNNPVSDKDIDGNQSEKTQTSPGGGGGGDGPAITTHWANPDLKDESQRIIHGTMTREEAKSNGYVTSTPEVELIDSGATSDLKPNSGKIIDPTLPIGDGSSGSPNGAREEILDATRKYGGDVETAMSTTGEVLERSKYVKPASKFTKALTSVGRGLGRIGYGLAGLNLFIDAYSLYKDKISLPRFGYHAAATIGAAAATFFGAPLWGSGIGLVAYSAEKMYDLWIETKPARDNAVKQISDFQNAMKRGQIHPR